MHSFFLFVLLNIIFSIAFADTNNSQGKIVNFDFQDHESAKIFKQIHNNLDKKISNLKPLQEPVNIGTFLFDLNGDGKKELFVYIDDHLFCGSKGCTTKIIDLSGEKAATLLEANTYKTIYILSEKTNGYNNLGIGGDKETHIKPDIIILYWDGIQYNRLYDRKTK